MSGHTGCGYNGLRKDGTEHKPAKEKDAMKTLLLTILVIALSGLSAGSAQAAGPEGFVAMAGQVLHEVAGLRFHILDGQLLAWFLGLSTSERMFFLLILTVLVTLLLTIAFTLVTVKLRIGNTRKAARWAKLESAWQPLLLAVIAGDATPVSLINQIEDNDRLFFLDYLTHYASRLAGAELRILNTLAAPFLPLLETRLAAKDYEQRARSIHTLGIFAAGYYQADFIHLLDDRSPLVALTAARALAATRNLNHVPALFARVDRFETWSPKFLATLFTGMGSGVAPHLRDKIADPEIPAQARLVALEVLIELRDIPGADNAAALLTGSETTAPGYYRRATDPAAAILIVRETDVNLRAAALRLIAAVGLPRHLPVIRTELASPNPILRSHAATALGTIVKPAAPADLDRLELCLNDNTIWVAIQAVGALINAGGFARMTALVATAHPRAELVRQFLTERRQS